ncbi:MAG: enterotoxin [Candidatus Acidiferrales bacterium]
MTRREFVNRGALLLGSFPAASFLGRSPLAEILQDTQDEAHAQIQAGTISLGNALVSAQWQISQAGLQLTEVKDLRNGQTIAGPKPAFSLALADGSRIISSAMRMLDAPKIEDLAADPRAARLSERLPGRALTASFEDSQRRLRATWRAILRDGSNYLRQEVEFSSLKDNLPIAKVTMLDLDVVGAEVVGSVKGSPAASRTWFFGFEHPLSQSAVEADRLLCTIERQLPLEHGRAASYSSVIGVTAPGQLRRDFLRYIERERAHPYRTFLHYNSWYDLGYFTPYDQAGALDVIHAFGQELHAKRGVTLDSFLFDDGWDNHKSLWSFNSGFPHGFTPVKHAAAKYHAAPGIWLSPWGGYDGPRKERLEFGKQQGYEENSGGFVLSGPRYFKRFREVCLEMIRTYGINQFKFDGTGNASTVFPGSEFDSDFAAMISLIGDLRVAGPDLYVNLTTGTYPSPFWLRCADSIWRDGDDHSFAGVGSNRQQWITYRDSATHEYVVRRGPLYPLNSLMLHGLIYARDAEKLNNDPGHDFPAEVHSYFGTGTQLQEMYITHSLLSESDWNVLAESARWSRRNADILVDTHWIGGDPAHLEVYGWASWSRHGGIVTLRNPDKVPHSFDLDPQSTFELPPDAAQNYVARSPWKNGAPAAEINLRAGQSHTFTLQPFEVLTLEAAAR